MEITEKDQAHKFWDANPIDLSNVWTANAVVGEEIYKRMSAGKTTAHWLTWLITDYFAGRKFKSLLSPGCGTGDHEIMMAQSGIVGEIDAFDFSEASLDIARQKARDAGVSIKFYQDDINNFVIEKGKTYDLVMCSGSLHHTKELEHFFSTVQSVLAPNGFFIVNEYVGACYNIYDKRKVAMLERLYRCIPPSLRSGRMEHYHNPTIQEALALDPSESVRSALIVPFLNEYFDVKLFHPFGGQLLHPLYQLLDHAQFSEREPRIETILRLLLEFEAILMDMDGGLESDFCLCVCGLKQ
jgi:ubiquinone/menaquinone biosynthesis C-methylase UbiE